MTFRFFSLPTFLSCLWAALASAATGAEPQEIRVQLSTASSLSPIYVGKISAERSSLDAKYLAELESVLQFDLNYNGSTKVLPRQDQKERLLSQKNEAALEPKRWKEMGVPYVVRLTIFENNLSVVLLSVASGVSKQLKDIPLKGTLSDDRRQIHKIADNIHKALFNKEGVASSHLLYSVQIKPQAGEDSISEIWECDWDGANARQVTKERSYSVTPVYVPGSGRFIYVSYKLGQPKICIASIKDGASKRLVPLPGNQLLPAISAQKDKVAFISDAAGRSDLFVQPINPETGEGATPFQLFSYPRATQASPTFNPSGSQLAFVSDKDGSARIYVIPASPSEKRANPILISKQNAENSCPSWSPDGTKLAYSAKTKGIRQIWIYDFEERIERQLTDGPGNKENPVWAKDSVHIVFNSTDGHSSELYLVNLNQPEAIKITKGPGKKHYPNWGT